MHPPDAAGPELTDLDHHAPHASVLRLPSALQPAIRTAAISAGSAGPLCCNAKERFMPAGR
jgi:hypothetical protein